MSENTCCYLQNTVCTKLRMCALRYHFLKTELEDPCELQYVEASDLVIIDRETRITSGFFYGVVVTITDNNAAIFTDANWVVYKDKRSLQKLRVNDYSKHLRDDLFVRAAKRGFLHLKSCAI